MLNTPIHAPSTWVLIYQSVGYLIQSFLLDISYTLTQHRHFGASPDLVNNINREWSLSTCLWKKWPRGTGCPHCFVADGFWFCSPDLSIHFHLFLLPEMVSSVVSQLSWPDKCAACIKRAPPPPKKKRHIRDIYLWKSVRLKIYHCQESRLIRSLGMSGVNTSYPNWSVRVADDSLRSWKTMRLRQPPKWHIGFQVPAILARWCRSSNCTWSGLSRNLLTHMSMESKLTLSFNLRFNISLHSILHSP